MPYLLLKMRMGKKESEHKNIQIYMETLEKKKPCVNEENPLCQRRVQEWSVEATKENINQQNPKLDPVYL